MCNIVAFTRQQWLSVLLNSTLDSGAWLTTRFGLSPSKRKPQYSLGSCWVDSRACLDVLQKIKYLAPRGNKTRDFPSRRLSHYTGWHILTPEYSMFEHKLYLCTLLVPLLCISKVPGSNRVSEASYSKDPLLLCSFSAFTSWASSSTYSHDLFPTLLSNSQSARFYASSISSWKCVM